MRKATLLGAAAALALGVVTTGASPAKADFDVTADIDKWQSVRIIELIVKVKLVGLFAIIVNRPDRAAESEALYNQRNERNSACENCAEKVFTLVDSMNRNRGITVLNAADGNMNNQGAAISIAFTGEGRWGFAEAQASGTQLMRFNRIKTIAVPFRNARIANSLNGNRGVTVLNTAPGNINNQAFALSVAVARPDGVSLSEADLGQVNAGNQTFERDVTKGSAVANSVNRNRGITSVNIAVGNGANQSNTVALAVAGR